jgi:hypothetical protein
MLEVRREELDHVYWVPVLGTSYSGLGTQCTEYEYGYGVPEFSRKSQPVTPFGRSKKTIESVVNLELSDQSPKETKGKGSQRSREERRERGREAVCEAFTTPT